MSEPATAAAPGPRVMLLSVWVSAATGWRAQLVDADARRVEFHSPFELARFLAQPDAPLAPPAQGGLR